MIGDSVTLDLNVLHTYRSQRGDSPQLASQWAVGAFPATLKWRISNIKGIVAAVIQAITRKQSWKDNKFT